jgi:hypothetical protein
MRPWLPIGVLVAVSAGCHRESPRLRGFPQRMLWAWESPQDLRFLKHGEGVAFLAGELHLDPGGPRWQPRRNPLRVNPQTPLVAVIRVEAKEVPEFAHIGALVEQARICAALPGVRGLQIDFDATRSQRPWYTEALKAVRKALPEAMPISITALASWCWGDPWIRDLPVDEAVPMLFRMSADEAAIRALLAQGREVAVPEAAHSWGISTDEPLPRLRPGRRIYAFHPGSWTEGAWANLRERLP